MIQRLINKLLGRVPSKAGKFGKRVELTVAEHGIDPSLVDDRAKSVVRTLKQAGFEAYIVGGAVRDLLLGLRPKDFDVATSATPEQVKALFRRAFIIGRRFRIVHVVFGRGREHEVIEVSTFRAYLDASSAEPVRGNEKTSRSELAGLKHAVDASGRVLRDNVWGPQEEDAARRDFTINAMYYDPEAQVVVDYHQGLKDARARVIRMIGDPAARYREDPVRLIRAVRFAAKLSALGFTLERKTAAPIASCKNLLADVPQSRLFDEMLKLLQTGHALASVAQVQALGLASSIDALMELVVQRAAQPLVRAVLQDTDRRVAEGKPVAPSFLLAAVLWPDVREGWQRHQAQQASHPALLQAIDDVFAARIGDVSGRGKLAADMREIWLMQPRFEKRIGSTPFSLVEQPRFRAGFDFMRLRAETGELDMVLADWWEEFSLADDALRRDMVDEVRLELQQQRKASSRSPRSAARPQRPDAGVDAHATRSATGQGTPPAGDGLAVDPAGDDGASEAPADAATKPKRRRRRRKPAGERGHPGAEGSSPQPDAAD